MQFPQQGHAPAEILAHLEAFKTQDLQQGAAAAVGNFISGGTESILLSIKRARDRARDLCPPITQPNIVIPETGHSSL